MVPFLDLHTHRTDNTPAHVIALRSIDLCREEFPDNTQTPLSVGLHPWHIDEKELSALLFQLRQYARQENVYAIGECGLDRCCKVDMILQKRAFIEQCLLAHAERIPCILHIVKAWEELFDCLKQMRTKLPTFIIHGFRGKKDLAQSLIRKGFYLSLGMHYSPDVLHIAWQAQRLFLETDEADNNIEEIYHRVSNHLGVPLETLRSTLFQQGAQLLSFPRSFAALSR